MKSFPIWDRTHVPCIGRQILNQGTTREVLTSFLTLLQPLITFRCALLRLHFTSCLSDSLTSRPSHRAGTSLHGCSLSKIDGDLITQLVATLLLLLLLKNMSKNQDVLIGIKLNVF